MSILLLLEKIFEERILTERPGNGSGRNLFRPFIIATLTLAAFFLSALFLSSPEALSQKISGESGGARTPTSALDSPAPQAAPSVEGKEDLRRFDFKVAENKTFYYLMSLLGVSGSDIQAMVKEAAPVYDLRQLKPDSVVRAFTEGERLHRVEYRFSEYETLVVERGADESFKASRSELPHEVRVSRVTGTIESSLYEDGTRAGADPQTVMALSDIFAWDVDFASDIQKGDSFNILTEVLYVEGRPVKTGKILGAEMVNGGKKYTAIYFEGGGGASYYDAEGRSLRRTLLKSPLRFRRITSRFTNSRFHPILKRYRPHHGIDYGAPTGTPVESAGAGKVTFAGWKNGYGNFIEIRHNNNYSTGYGHLSRINRGVRAGAKIDQGEVIGFVGSTGISTGPHLHYEVRLGKTLINPLSIKPVPDASIAKKDKEKFLALKGEITRELVSKETLMASGAAPADEENRLSKEDQAIMRHN